MWWSCPPWFCKILGLCLILYYRLILLLCYYIIYYIILLLILQISFSFHHLFSCCYINKYAEMGFWRLPHWLFVGFGSLRGSRRGIFVVILHQPLYFPSDAPCEVMVGRVWGVRPPSSRYARNRVGLSWSLRLWLWRYHFWQSTFQEVRCLFLVRFYTTVTRTCKKKTTFTLLK